MSSERNDQDDMDISISTVDTEGIKNWILINIKLSINIDKNILVT